MSTILPAVSFAGKDLAANVPGLRVVAIPFRPPVRNLQTFPIARADKSVTSASWFTAKKQNVIVELGCDTKALLMASIDALMGIIGAQEATLQITAGGILRQWTATYGNLVSTTPDGANDFNGGLITLDIEFECSDPLGYDTSSTNIFSETVTTASDTQAFTLGGTALWQQPIITITLSALTGGTNATVSVGNPATGQTLNILRTWTAGDVLVINTNTGVVTVNGTVVATTGGLPQWAVGAGSMSYLDTFTTRTRQVVAVYTKKYI